MFISLSHPSPSLLSFCGTVASLLLSLCKLFGLTFSWSRTDQMLSRTRARILKLWLLINIHTWIQCIFPVMSAALEKGRSQMGVFWVVFICYMLRWLFSCMNALIINLPNLTLFDLDASDYNTTIPCTPAISAWSKCVDAKIRIYAQASETLVQLRLLQIILHNDIRPAWVIYALHVQRVCVTSVSMSYSRIYNSVTLPSVVWCAAAVHRFGA